MSSFPVGLMLALLALQNRPRYPRITEHKPKEPDLMNEPPEPITENSDAAPHVDTFDECGCSFPNGLPRNRTFIGKCPAHITPADVRVINK